MSSAAASLQSFSNTPQVFHLLGSVFAAGLILAAVLMILYLFSREIQAARVARAADKSFCARPFPPAREVSPYRRDQILLGRRKEAL